MAAETACLPIIEEEEEEQIDEDFYEKIEAPKFVDLTAPDKRPPDDDRHWFCFRVGCDQRHEQELDPEEIYKNFVLRVMAARSPNVKLRNALDRRQASRNMKCPLTAPAKPRVSRMAMISSLSHKMRDNNVKVKPLPKVAATPNAKLKQSPSVTKALTAPRNPKKASTTEQFRSVQSKKVMSVAVPKSRMVAKALVFHSPKKVVKTKFSTELNTPMKALCSAMKKIDLNGVKKNGDGCNNSLPVASSRKQLKGREVKSRVFESLYSKNPKEPETNTVTCLKEKKVKGMQKRQVTVPHENDYSDMEMDEKSTRGDSLERYAESGTSGGVSEISQEPKSGESSTRVSSEACKGDIASSSSSNEEEKSATEGSENEERRNLVSGMGKVLEAKTRKAKENSVASNEKENEVKVTDIDDKENASAPSENIEVSTNSGEPKKVVLGNKHEERKTHKKSALTTTGSQVVKYRKLKPTNPIPFKLRTDERGILKEANLDKKIPSLVKETPAKGGKAIRKHQSVNKKSGSCSGQSEQDSDNYSSCDEKPNQATKENKCGNIQNDNFNSRKVQQKLSATKLYKKPVCELQKPINLDENFRRKSEMIQRRVVRPRSALSRKKDKVDLATACKLSVILEKPSEILKPKEAARPLKNDASSPTSKTAGSTSRPCSRGRRALIVPKEPKFQSLHVPKSCTTRQPV